ncbi:hypothetical protein GOV07_04505 [Candidatus Woesearchaeota archaeon]|nr:hypothetical protein [Candidatus Woesearchaeota archaeon]
MKLLVLGNSALSFDNLALKVGGALKPEHEVIHLENPLDLLEHDLEQAVIIDAAMGVKEPRLIEDLDRIKLGNLCSLHDFDMAFFMKLLKRIGQLDQVRIIALPMHATVEEVLPKVQDILHNL